MTSQLVEQYNRNEYQHILNRMPHSLFPDLKRRSKVIAIGACVPNIQKWASQYKDHKRIVQELLELLDSGLRQRRSRRRGFTRQTNKKLV